MGIRLENWTIEEQTGYRPITTFYLDFSIADKFGLDAIQDTYNRAFAGWKDNFRYITELVMVLNWKCFRWFGHNDDYSKLYQKLYEELNDWCFDNLKGVELDYFIETTD